MDPPEEPMKKTVRWLNDLSMDRPVELQHCFNLIVTNVPGPAVPLYALGAKLLEAFPILPLVGNQSLAVAALSYEGQLNMGVLSDPATCPDAQVFCAGVQACHEALVERCQSAAEDP